MSRQIRILVVDDEPAVCDVLCSGLEAAGMRAARAMDKAEMLAALAAGSFDLITLDLSLGSADGLVLAREIRAGYNLPIIMISGRVSAVDRVKGLEFGADDYVTKPFHLAEVVLRIRNVLRRYPSTAGADDPAAQAVAERLAFDAGALDMRKRALVDAGGARVDLTDSEFRLLELFLRNPSRILTRDEIMRGLRSRDWSPEERLLDGHVARLRQKIEPPSEAPRLIKTVRGVGYVFTGEVTPA